MTFPCPTNAERQQLVERALLSFAGSADYAELFKLSDRLFEMALTPNELLHDDVDNPPTHHTIVLGHMMEIAKGFYDRDMFDWSNVKQAAAISILHDICPVARITQETIDAAPEADRPALQRKREESVPVHMSEGAKMARVKIDQLNVEMGVFTGEDIDEICRIIGIHDNPKLKRKMPSHDLMAVAFREADRLWMVTPEGINSDLVRKQKKDPQVNPQDRDAQLAQVRHSIRRFVQERRLYDEKADGPFQDDSTFFRTEEGFAIYKRCLGKWGISQK